MPGPSGIDLVIVEALRDQNKVCEAEINSHSDHRGNQACPDGS